MVYPLHSMMITPSPTVKATVKPSPKPGAKAGSKAGLKHRFVRAGRLPTSFFFVLPTFARRHSSRTLQSATICLFVASFFVYIATVFRLLQLSINPSSKTTHSSSINFRSSSLRGAQPAPVSPHLPELLIMRRAGVRPGSGMSAYALRSLTALGDYETVGIAGESALEVDTLARAALLRHRARPGMRSGVLVSDHASHSLTKAVANGLTVAVFAPNCSARAAWLGRRAEDADVYVDVPLSVTHAALSATAFHAMFGVPLLGGLGGVWACEDIEGNSAKLGKDAWDEYSETKVKRILMERLLTVAGFPFVTDVVNGSHAVELSEMLDAADRIAAAAQRETGSVGSDVSSVKGNAEVRSYEANYVHGKKEHAVWSRDEDGHLFVTKELK